MLEKSISILDITHIYVKLKAIFKIYYLPIQLISLMCCSFFFWYFSSSFHRIINNFITLDWGHKWSTSNGKVLSLLKVVLSVLHQCGTKNSKESKTGIDKTVANIGLYSWYPCSTFHPTSGLSEKCHD